VAGTVALVAAPVLFSAAPTAAAGPQASVGTEVEFWNAWTDPDVTQIDLTASIELHSGSGNGTCSPNIYPERDAVHDTLVDGHGFTLTMNCSKNAVLYQFSTSGSPSLTVQDITLTHAGAPTPTATGNGIVNESGDVIVHDSTITGNWVSDDTCLPEAEVSVQFLCVGGGGGIAANGDVWIDDSAVTNNRAPVGGGIYAQGRATAVDTRVAGNLALTADSAVAGGGILAHGGADLTNVEVTQNFAGCEAECEALGGGLGTFGPTTVTGSSFVNNDVGCETACGNYGGGIFVAGALEVAHSTLSQNRATCEEDCAADGGGVFSAGRGVTGTAVEGPFDGVQASEVPTPGTVTILDTLFSANEATTTGEAEGQCDCSGGGLLVIDQSSLLVSGSTFSANVAFFAGGAMALYRVEAARVVNSTITGNDSGELGAIAADEDVALTLVHDTITDNSVHPIPEVTGAASQFFEPLAVGDVRSTAAEPASLGGDAAVTIFGTVITGSVGGPNCAAEDVTSQGWNFADDTSCGFTDTANGDDQASGNTPLLGALGDNGGPTPTQLPTRSSPLVNAIPAGSCQAGAAAGVTVDQRGIARPQGAGCDIGSVEVPPPSPDFTG
jgi:hypothetical protein